MTVRQPDKVGARSNDGRPRKEAGLQLTSAGIVLDRDESIVEEVGHINHIDCLKLFPWTVEDHRKLSFTRPPERTAENLLDVADVILQEVGGSKAARASLQPPRS